MDHLDREELTKSVQSLLSILQCPVCLALLDKNALLCVNGHAVCIKCRGNQGNCPTCRCSFLNLDQNVIISQILENIPHPCRFDKCSHMVKSGEDHELYCRFRPTKCEYDDCQWSGPVENISFHLEDKHPKEKVYSGLKALVKIPKSYVESNSKTPSLISGCGHYIWQFTKRENDMVHFTYLPVFVGKPIRDIFLKIWFKSEEKEHFACFKMKKTEDNGSCFIFPASMISKFIVENELKYHLIVTEERNDAINMSPE